MNVFFFLQGCQLIMGDNVDRELLQSIQCEVKELVNVFTAIQSQLGNRLPEAEREELPDVLPRLQSFERQFSNGLRVGGFWALAHLLLWLGVPFDIPSWFPVWLSFWRRLLPWKKFTTLHLNSKLCYQENEYVFLKLTKGRCLCSIPSLF